MTHKDNHFIYLVLIISGCLFFGFFSRDAHKNDIASKEYHDGNYIEAEKLYRDALIDNPDSPELQYNHANASYRLEDYQETVSRLESMAIKNSSNVLIRSSALYNLGNAYYQVGEYDAAIRCYQQCLIISPDDKEAQFNLERLEDEKNKYELFTAIDDIKSPRDQQKKRKQSTLHNQQSTETEQQSKRNVEKGEKSEDESGGDGNDPGITPGNKQGKAADNDTKFQDTESQEQASSQENEQLQESELNATAEQIESVEAKRANEELKDEIDTQLDDLDTQTKELQKQAHLSSDLSESISNKLTDIQEDITEARDDFTETCEQIERTENKQNQSAFTESLQNIKDGLSDIQEKINELPRDEKSDRTNEQGVLEQESLKSEAREINSQLNKAQQDLMEIRSENNLSGHDTSTYNDLQNDIIENKMKVSDVIKKLATAEPNYEKQAKETLEETQDHITEIRAGIEDLSRKLGMPEREQDSSVSTESQEQASSQENEQLQESELNATAEQSESVEAKRENEALKDEIDTQLDDLDTQTKELQKQAHLSSDLSESISNKLTDIQEDITEARDDFTETCEQIERTENKQNQSAFTESLQNIKDGLSDIQEKINELPSGKKSDRTNEQGILEQESLKSEAREINSQLNEAQQDLMEIRSENNLSGPDASTYNDLQNDIIENKMKVSDVIKNLATAEPNYEKQAKETLEETKDHITEIRADIEDLSRKLGMPEREQESSVSTESQEQNESASQESQQASMAKRANEELKDEIDTQLDDLDTQVKELQNKKTVSESQKNELDGMQQDIDSSRDDFNKACKLMENVSSLGNLHAQQDIAESLENIRNELNESQNRITDIEQQSLSNTEEKNAEKQEKSKKESLLKSSQEAEKQLNDAQEDLRNIKSKQNLSPEVMKKYNNLQEDIIKNRMQLSALMKDFETSQQGFQERPKDVLQNKLNDIRGNVAEICKKIEDLSRKARQEELETQSKNHENTRGITDKPQGYGKESAVTGRETRDTATIDYDQALRLLNALSDKEREDANLYYKIGTPKEQNTSNKDW